MNVAFLRIVRVKDEDDREGEQGIDHADIVLDTVLKGRLVNIKNCDLSFSLRGLR